MTSAMQLGYLVLEVADLDAWTTFVERELGLTQSRCGDDVLVRVDSLQQRMVLERGPADDLSALGLLFDDEVSLAQVVTRLGGAGVEVSECSAEVVARRRMRRVWAFTDPTGIRVELATGAIHAVEPFSSAVVPGGFVTGAEGLGHAVLVVDEIDAALEFWTQLLGFRLSDSSSHETPAGESRAYFLHCNARHHSIAFVRRPERSTYPRRLLHFMVEAATMDSVGCAFDRALDAGLDIPRSLGRHPNDKMLSFYATTPSGFDYEFGWGAVKVTDDWPVAHYDHISSWGHRRIERGSAGRG